jgi:hypothetical protein
MLNSRYRLNFTLIWFYKIGQSKVGVDKSSILIWVFIFKKGYFFLFNIMNECVKRSSRSDVFTVSRLNIENQYY